VLKYFRETDVSWCYWPLDPIAIPRNFNGVENSFKLETYGIFDTLRYDYSAVIGWKLQDLISIMPPSEDLPAVLPVPPECAFEQAANEERAAEETSMLEFLTTLSWTPEAQALVLGFLFLLCVVPMLCGCLVWLLLRRHRAAAAAKVVERPLVEPKYHPLSSMATTNAGTTHFRSTIGTGMGTGMSSYKTKMRTGAGIGNTTASGHFPTDYGTKNHYDLPFDPEPDRGAGGTGFFCCSTAKGSSARRNTTWATSAAPPPASARRVS